MSKQGTDRRAGVCPRRDPGTVRAAPAGAGFSPLPTIPVSPTRCCCARRWRRWRRADIVIAETGAFGINVLDPDAGQRDRNIAEICRRLESADNIGSLCCVAHGGWAGSNSFNKHYPENFSARSVDHLVAAVQRIIDTVRPRRTRFVLETESRYLPDSADLYLEILQAVGPAGVRRPPGSGQHHLQSAALLRQRGLHPRLLRQARSAPGELPRQGHADAAPRAGALRRDLRRQRQPRLRRLFLRTGQARRRRAG